MTGSISDHRTEEFLLSLLATGSIVCLSNRRQGHLREEKTHTDREMSVLVFSQDNMLHTAAHHIHLEQNEKTYNCSNISFLIAIKTVQKNLWSLAKASTYSSWPLKYNIACKYTEYNTTTKPRLNRKFNKSCWGPLVSPLRGNCDHVFLHLFMHLHDLKWSGTAWLNASAVLPSSASCTLCYHISLTSLTDSMNGWRQICSIN